MRLSFVKRSLYADLLIIVTLTITAIVSLYGLHIHSKMKERFSHQIQREASMSIQSLEKNLATLLSSYAINAYEKLIYTEMELRNPFAIVVHDFNMAKVTGQEQYITGFIALGENKIEVFEPLNEAHTQALQRTFYQQKRDLMDDNNQKIGEITLYMSDALMIQELHEAFVEALIGVILLIFILLVILMWAIKHMALNPLIHMSRTMVDVDKDGIPKALMPEAHHNEIATISETINTMLHTIKSSRIELEDSHKEALRLSRLNRLIIETIPDLLWLKDAEGKYLLCNEKFEQLYGAKEKEIVNKTDYDFVERSLADFFRDNDKKAMQAGTAVINEETLTFANDGRSLLFETTKVPLVEANGSVIGVMGIAHDITEYKMLIAELDTLRKLYLSLLNAIPLHIIRFDIEGKMTFANKTFLNLLHGQHEDLMGTNGYELHQKHIADEYRKSDQKVIESKKMSQTTHIFSLPPFTSQKIIEMIRIPILDSMDNVKEIQAVFWDVTEKISKEQELEYSAPH